MRSQVLTVAAAALIIATTAATAQDTLEGRLELAWGDPLPREVQGRAASLRPLPPQFRVTLVADDGSRIALDPAQALAAADDLHALGGRRVAVALSPAPARDPSPVRIDAIVHADAGDLGPAAVLGNTVWRTIACRFADIATEQKPLSFFQGQYGTGQGQLDHYWREVSHGKIHLTGSSAHGWYTLPHPRSHYVTGTGQGAANLSALFTDCVGVADPHVDFATNGGVQGINMMFNGDLDGYAWGGSRCATLDGINKCWSTTWNPPWSFNNLSPLAHEMGHGYGLPHANNSDGDNDPYDNPWDVMSSAWHNAGNDPVYGSVAKHINSWHRDRLGWVDAARKLEVQAGQWLIAQRLDRAGLANSVNPQMIVVRRPGDPSSRYWTVETRRRVGYYESSLAGNAVIIHSIDTGRSTPAQSVDADVPPATLSNNEGSMFKPGETWTAPDGSFRIRVWPADGDAFTVSVCGPAPTLERPRKSDRCMIGPVFIGPPSPPR